MAAKKKTPTNGTTLVSTKSKIKTDVPLLTAPEDINSNAFNVTAEKVNPDLIDYTDPSFNFDKITSNKITADTLANRFMTAADYTMVDPSQVQSQYGDISRSETAKNSALSSQLALDSLDTELKGLQNYAPTAANLQRQEIAKDNTANSAARLASLDAADPSIRGDLSSQAERARSYAEGKVPNSILDRQLELGIQSSSADRAAVGGFGAGSSAAAKAGSLMSAEARIGLSQYGDQLLSSNITNRTATEVAPTEYSNAGSQISAVPSQSAGQTAMQIASQLNAGNINAKDALASKTQQGEFKAGLEQDTNKTNLQVQSDRDLNQAKLDIQADTTSEANRLTAETTNQDNSIKTQLAGKQISSAEKQFNAQLSTNTAISNADRSFSAANANAGRALETATSNRAVKLQVDSTNKTMVFQDQQRVKAEQAAARASAAANAGANARAAMSAGAQSAAIAAQQSEAEKDRQFQLQQQQTALDIYKQNRSDAQSSSNAAAAGTLITRAPAVISGVSSLINTVSGWFGGSSTPDVSSLPSGDFSIPDFGF